MEIFEGEGFDIMNLKRIISLTKIIRHYECQCGNKKTTESWGIIILGYLIDFTFFPFGSFPVKVEYKEE